MTGKFSGPLPLRCPEFLRKTATAATAPLVDRLFLDAYRVADECYWNLNASRCDWRSLGGILEYSPDLVATTGKGEAPVLVMAFRSTARAPLGHVFLNVKVKRRGTIYRQEIGLSRLDRVPTRKVLAAIPLDSIPDILAGRQRMGDVYIKLERAVDADGDDLIGGEKVMDVFPATVASSAPRHEVELFDRYWNIDAVDREKENIRIRGYRTLVYAARQTGRHLGIRRLAYRLLASRPGLSCAFWTRNLWNPSGTRACLAALEPPQSSYPGNPGI